MFITTTTTPDDGPGFKVTARSSEIDVANLDDLTAQVLYAAGHRVPVAFFVITIPPLGRAVYAPNFSSTEDRIFLASFCHAEFYDIALVRWEDEVLVTWMSKPIDDVQQGPAIIEQLLALPTPSHKDWDSASDRVAAALGAWVSNGV